MPYFGGYKGLGEEHNLTDSLACVPDLASTGGYRRKVGFAEAVEL